VTDDVTAALQWYDPGSCDYDPCHEDIRHGIALAREVRRLNVLVEAQEKELWAAQEREEAAFRAGFNFDSQPYPVVITVDDATRIWKGIWWDKHNETN